MPERRRIRIYGYKGDRKRKSYSQRWRSQDEIDTNMVLEWEGFQPWSQQPLSAVQEDYIEALDNLKLKGRQKQVLKLLREGVLNQVEIARRLGMSQPNVARALRSIAKKLLKK